MPFNDAIFWVSVTIFGTGLFVLFEHRVWGAILTVVGVVGIVYSVLKHRTTPIVEPVRFGRAPNGFGDGIYVTVRGDPVYEVQAEPITLLGEWVLHFDETISRLDGDGFLAGAVSRGNTTSYDVGHTWVSLKQAAGLPAIFPLIIKYRDTGERWYRSVCELHRDVMKDSGFDVKFTRQQRIRKWAWPRLN